MTTADAPDSPTPTYVGIAVAGVGFLLMLLAWGVVAGRDDINDQLAPAVGIGLPALGLVMVGLTIVNVATKAADQRSRQRQLERLVGIVEELGATGGEEPSP